jgi:CheY-like chemotaxis protein
VSAKRALIVDDSKSARVVLARMLEKYGMQVDTIESAEDAIEYLKSHRPDVIFMDHLMPGMDGFQAVQAIKGNPLTATIPIMMYTSQEGELYVGQARALGAIGVMPKQVAPVDVSKVLYQLKLLPDRRDPRPSGFQPANETAPQASVAAAGETAGGAAGTEAAGAVVAAAAGPAETPVPPKLPLPGLTSADVRAIFEPALKEQSAELRRFVVASLDSFAARVLAETRELVKSAVPPPAPPAPPGPPPAPAAPVGWIALALVGCAVALGTAFYAWQQHATLAALQAQVAALAVPKPVPAPVAQLAAANAAAALEPASPGAESNPPPAASRPATQTFPAAYGETPLSGARIEALRELFADLDGRRFAGTVRITTHVGDFCLVGNPGEGYALAPPDMPANRCDLVGNPFDDALRPAQRQSVAFANLLADVRSRANGRYEVTVAHVGRDGPRQPYPDGAEVDAVDWNAIAGVNHRVEVVFESAGTPP